MADGVCGTGGWTGPLPGDPDTTNISIAAVTAFGGIRVSWSYPLVNPHAVAHTLVYRARDNNFLQASLRNVAAGSSFFDEIDVLTPTTYYYWIRIISVNGTEGTLIGPASATAIPRSTQTLEEITGKINAGDLAQALRNEIGRVAPTYNELMQEIADRVAANTALSQLLIDLQNGLVDAITLINNEVISRIDGNNAFISVLNTVAAANVANVGMITEEQTIRVSTDEALAYQINQVAVASAEGTAAAVKEAVTTKIGYSVIATGPEAGTAYDGDGSTIVYPVSLFPAVGYPEYAVNRTRIIDSIGVDLWNGGPAGPGKPLLWLTGLPLASAIKTVGIAGPTGTYASLEQGFAAQLGLNNEFKGQYTARVDVNGLVGGFGIYNDGEVVEAGFDVDKFWIGKAANIIKPFIIENGIVYMNNVKMRYANITGELKHENVTPGTGAWFLSTPGYGGLYRNGVWHAQAQFNCSARIGPGLFDLNSGYITADYNGINIFSNSVVDIAANTIKLRSISGSPNGVLELSNIGTVTMDAVSKAALKAALGI